MTFQQKRTRIRIARVIFDYCWVIGIFTFSYYFVYPYDIPMMLGILAIILLWGFVMNLFDKKKILFVPDEIGKNELSSTRVDFSNSFDWLTFVYILIWIIFVTLVSTWGNHMDQVFQYKSQAIMAAVFLLGFVVWIAYYSRNRYVIEGEMLYIKEYGFFRPVTEIRIPINQIDAIYIKAPYSAVRSRLVLTVGGVERVLWCTTHIIPLASALSKRKL